MANAFAPIYKGGIPFLKPGIRFLKNAGIGTGAGAPTNGTSGSYAGKLNKGSLYLDSTNGNVYINVGTQASPTWQLLGGAGVLAFSTTDGITANSGGGQTNATALTTTINHVTTVVSAGDSVKLPAVVAGAIVIVTNKASQPMQVFGAGTDTINGVATATGVSQGVWTEAIYLGETSGPGGNWVVTPSALYSEVPTAVGSASFAVPAHISHAFVFNRAGVVAATLAAATAGGPGTGDDGNIYQFTSDSAQAHTITFTGSTLDSGSAAALTATFNAFKGASLEVMAFNGRYKVLSANGVSFS